MKKLIENSYKNLKKGGLLVFDINSEYKMKKFLVQNLMFMSMKIFFILGIILKMAI
ncbi:MAG: hypothetical protein ACLTA5_06105 [Anaerococcus obesiensis]